MRKFKQLTPADYQRLKPFFKDLRYEHCEYCLPTLLIWITEEFQPYGMVAGNTLIIAAEYRTLDYRHLILPLSPDTEYSPAELRALAIELGHDKYWFVPDSYINRYGMKEIRRFFTLSELGDYRDYIYLVDDLCRLEGNRYARKRNLIKQFQKNYLLAGRTAMEEISAANRADCIDFLEEWCRLRQCDQQADNDLICEKKAAIDMLNHIETFDSRGMLLRIDGTVSAFGIISPLTRNMAVMQFEKAFESVKGLYQFFDQECIKRLCRGYTYLNKESDMNLPNLAKAKKSYYPARFVKVYELSLKSSARQTLSSQAMS